MNQVWAGVNNTEKVESAETGPPVEPDVETKAERLGYVNARLVRLSKEAEALAKAIREAPLKK